ncbi:MAG: glycerate 2-kinase, partial [Thermoleophilaceae bacterium]|nr:glycerate 2-kinase [Thermoleophilaceae bacterium]
MRQSRWWLKAPVLVAPDKFKGTMSAAEVAAAIASGLREAGRAAEELPVADGGEGTADAMLRALGGRWITAQATDALGRPVEAR